MTLRYRFLSCVGSGICLSSAESMPHSCRLRTCSKHTARSAQSAPGNAYTLRYILKWLCSTGGGVCWACAVHGGLCPADACRSYAWARLLTNDAHSGAIQRSVCHGCLGQSGAVLQSPGEHLSVPYQPCSRYKRFGHSPVNEGCWREAIWQSM